MRMELGAEAFSRLSALTATACGGTAAVLSTASEWTMALLGVPLVVVLAAVAGVALVVSYQPHQEAAVRLWTTIVASVFVACSVAVFAMEYGKWPRGAGAFTAAAAGTLLQVVVPWLIAKGPGILDRLVARLPWLGGGSGSGGSQ
jgi:hypothetical protein